MKLNINNNVHQFTPQSLLEIANSLNITDVLAAKVNGRLRELTYILANDADVEFLGYHNSEAIKIYETTLRYVVALAIKNVFPDRVLKYNYSVSRSILATFEGSTCIEANDIELIKNEITRLVKLDLPIQRKRIPLEEACAIYKMEGLEDKVEILKYRKEEYVNSYECDGYINYLFGYMLPSTGYLKIYEILDYAPGFLIRYPRAETEGKLPEFVDAKVYSNTLKEANKWGQITNKNTIAKINKTIENKHALHQFINLCETRHNNMLCHLGDDIASQIDDIRLIAVAGPSSSGKTTFTNRVKIELIARGITPLMISIDDYYLSRDQAPKDKQGNPDLEHVNALDLKQFNQDMVNLIQGKEVTLPHFNFKLGKREVGQTFKIDKKTPILIEGIHALNDSLTPSIPTHQKYKIYIAPQNQILIDNQNPISITELRLLRRMVRDAENRNTPASQTLAMWQSVRNGEFKWIYPYQEQANFVFNSELGYEIAVLKKHALEDLLNVPSDSPYFVSANRLVKFLKYFNDIPDELVPNNSLLREFIGGSLFE